MTEERGGGESIGKLFVDIGGDLSPLDQALADAKQKIESFIKKEFKASISVDVNTAGGGGRSRRGKDEAPPAGAIEQTAPRSATVDAKITANAKEVAAQVKAELERVPIQLVIDIPHIRGQIQEALRGVPLSAAPAGTGTASGIPVGGTQQAAAFEQAVRRGFSSELGTRLQAITGLGDSIDALYNEIRVANGQEPAQPGNQLDKLGEIVGMFGDDVKTWVREVKVGNLSASEGVLAKKLGVEAPGLDQLAASVSGKLRGSFMEDFVKELRGGTGGSVGQSEITKVADKLAAAVSESAQRESPAQRPESPRTAAAVTDAVQAFAEEIEALQRKGIELAPISTREIKSIGSLFRSVEPPSNRIAAATKRVESLIGEYSTANPRRQAQIEKILGGKPDELGEETLRGLPRRIVASEVEAQEARERRSAGGAARRVSRRFDLIGPGTNDLGAGLGTDPEAEEAALRQLGINNRANQRRLPTLRPLRGQVNGLDIDLRSLALEAARGDTGLLFGLARNAKTGEFAQLRPEGEAGSLEREASVQRIKYLLAGRRPRPLPGLEGEFTPVTPLGAISRIAEELFGEEGAAFAQRPEVAAELKKFISFGTTIGRGAAPPNRQGRAGRGFEHLVAAGPSSILGGLEDQDRFARLNKLLARVDNAIVNPETSDKRRSRLFDRRERLIAAGAATPEMIAGERTRHTAESQARIEEGFGLSTQEAAKRELESKLPEIIKQKIGLGALPNFVPMFARILDEVERGGFEGSTRGYASRRARDLSNLLLKGFKGPLGGGPEGTANLSALRGTLGVSDLTAEEAEGFREGLPRPIRDLLKPILSDLSRDIVGSIAPGPARHALVGGRFERGTSFAAQDARATDAGLGGFREFRQAKPTDIDQRIQQLESKVPAEARAIAEQRFAAMQAERAASGVSKDLFDPRTVEDFLYSPSIRRPQGGTIPGGIKPDIVAETESGREIASLRHIQAGAERLVTRLAAGGGDINQIRAAISGRVGAAGSPLTTEALQLLETRLPGHLREAIGVGDRRATGSGSEARAAFGQTAIVPPEFPDRDNEPRFSRINERFGSTGAGGGAGTGGGGGGNAGQFEVSGGAAVPVYVVNFREFPGVSAAPEAAVGGAEVSGGQAAIRARNRARFGSADFRNATSRGVQNFIKREVERLRTEGVSDEAIKAGLTQSGLGAAASIFFGRGGAGTGGGGGGGGGRGRGPAGFFGKVPFRNQLGPIEFLKTPPFGIGTTPLTMAETTGLGRQRQAALLAEQRAAATGPGAFFGPGPFTNQLGPISVAKQPRGSRSIAFDLAEPIGLSRQRQSALLAEQRALLRPPRTTRIADRNVDVAAAFRDEAQEQLERINGQLRRANRSVPKRGFGPSIVDLITSAVGGSGFEESLGNLNRAEAERGELSQLIGRQGELRARRAVLRDERRGTTDPDRRRQINAQILPINKELAQLQPAIERSTKIFQENVKAVTSANAILKNFGAAAVGGIASTAIGSVTFGLGMAVTAPLIQGVSEGIVAVLGPQVERLFGYADTTARITATRGEAIQQAGGRTDIASAQVALSEGLTARQAELLAPVDVRAQGELGNKLLKQQVDDLRARDRILKENAGRAGFDKSLFETTSGALGTIVNGVPSTAEIVGGALTQKPDVTGLTQERDKLATAVAISGGRYTGDQFDDRSRQRFLDTQRLDQLNAQLDRLSKGLDTGAATLDSFNSQAEKGGSALRLIYGTRDEVAKSAELARNAGLGAFAGQLEGAGVAVKGASKPQDIASFLAAVQKGPTVQSIDEFLAANKAGIESQAFTRQAQLNLNREQVQPFQRGLAFAQTPLVSATAGFAPEDAKRFGSDLSGVQKIFNGLRQESDAAIASAKEFVALRVPEHAGEFAASLDKVRSIGTDIANIQIGVQTAQAALAAKQYAFQIFQAKRAYQDALGLAGKITNTTNNLGAIQREQFQLQRESQSLGLEYSQRQINFQRAIAGITAPGLTGEERAARIKQAKIEAEYAQKQLDIQKKLFNLGGLEFKITVSRQLQDLPRQIALLTEGREVQLRTAVAEKKIQALTKLQEKENTKVELYYQEAVARTNDIIGLEASMIAATGRGLVEIRDKVLDTFATAYTKMRQQIDAYNPLGGGGGGGGGGRPHYTLASGGAFNTTGETSLTVGEAGTETVAVLRNPRQITGSFGGGGGTTVQINLSGNTFSSEEEQRKLIAKIQRAVEDGLGRRANQLGLRIPV